ncbi:putative transcriptional regulator [Oenococcus oeni]|uniref:TetR/AcrR family transcriptional regulator n=1 Tax=Oenococcus oeni TaxID=1247 RepID=UPI00107E1EDB|nr:TetR/AcrR family transcriptional regulator [Oenococcus oeni]AVI93649.1 TetR family transcriptional regulator [Oenococcus oeni]SYV98916.1 putative transcriptional regulator [Oenococcus oeni]SYW01057.1 putative transcriptional regulator [Oenococcus oeni]SYW14461.1 putative transcriptional regulator [Oenococcus oeni]SYW18439.1 putative transcriptional regulator [Oenococcus oeni]
MAKNTRDKIIETTISIIENKGIDFVNMRDLGAQIGLSRGAVYRHFKNKDDLLVTIAIQSFVKLSEHMSKTVRDNSKEQLINLLNYYYNFGIKHPSLYDLMFQKKWTTPEYQNLHAIATQSLEILRKFIPNTIDSAAVLAFIHGLIELTNSGHVEPEKGLDDPQLLISTFITKIYE